ncbi:FMN-linked oxidoreductase [Aspergillus steynii IBT 23096]|uniref:FMN-linked oxidoreductase n=1 Tax=Aspergillus steynii IBT 23096 TaxID=1392250 RepID=A0A2I2FRU1_9EURO|nr:FMN-linked oxidoreductase [Aspergillus steynii IBT 23096]PLB43352.1 FMN-linked oxidoreductase [Aspergillus steynii IBT 23096]
MSDSQLFKPLKVGDLDLQHRVVLAPLTRFKADGEHVPLPMVSEYYSQRASVPGTLLVSEATFISKRAGGYPNVPGIWSSDQIEAWKDVTAKVHKKGSFIFLQLWALGRVAMPDVAKAEGFDIVSSSPTALEIGDPVPRELTKGEIAQFVADYAQAARNAIAAGFDGVEIHGAGGYLIDQFTQENCNMRNDEYGGSVENRSRFLLEAVRAVVDAVGSEKVGLRLSPWQRYQGMRMEDPVPQFTHVISALNELKLAYLHLIEARVIGNDDGDDDDKINPFVDAWAGPGPVILAGGFNPDSAKALLEAEFKDKDILIAFGRHFISNPDLPFRIRGGLKLTPYDRKVFYLPMVKEGYVDYPFSNEFQDYSVSYRLDRWLIGTKGL